MLELTIRLVVSLAIVVGLLLLLARFGARKFRGSSGALVQVVHRQPLSRTSSVAVVTVGTRVLVLGTTEQQVSVLAELDPDEIELDQLDGTEDLDGDLLTLPVAPTGPRLVRTAPLAPPLLDEEPIPVAAPAPAPRPTRAPGSHRATPAARTVPGAGSGSGPLAGPLAGSVLSAHTWRQAFAVATNRSPKGAARRAS
jgi:flagellar protein FliO/FliZ